MFCFSSHTILWEFVHPPLSVSLRVAFWPAIKVKPLNLNEAPFCRLLIYVLVADGPFAIGSLWYLSKSSRRGFVRSFSPSAGVEEINHCLLSLALLGVCGVPVWSVPCDLSVKELRRRADVRGIQSKRETHESLWPPPTSNELVLYNWENMW